MQVQRHGCAAIWKLVYLQGSDAPLIDRLPCLHWAVPDSRCIDCADVIRSFSFSGYTWDRAWAEASYSTIVYVDGMEWENSTASLGDDQVPHSTMRNVSSIGRRTNVRTRYGVLFPSSGSPFPMVCNPSARHPNCFCVRQIRLHAESS